MPGHGNGIVYDGAVRDINGLEELPDFVAFVRYYDPSHHYGSLKTGKLLNSTMVSINAPDPHRSRDGRCREMSCLDATAGSSLFRHNSPSKWSNIPKKLICAIFLDTSACKKASTPRDKLTPAGLTPSNRITHQWLKQNEDHLPFPKARIEEILREHK